MYQGSNQQLVDSYMRAIEIRDKQEKSHYPDLMAELNRANRENKQQRDRILILENTVSLMRPNEHQIADMNKTMTTTTKSKAG